MLRRYKKYINNSGWLIGRRIIVAAINFIVIVFVARHLGAEDFGIFTFAFSLAAIFSVAGQLGIDGLVVREIANDPAKTSEVLGTIFVIKAIGYAVGAALVVAYALLLESSAVSQQALFCASIFVVLSLFNVVDPWFQATVQAKYVAISSIVATALSGVLKLCLVVLGLGVVAFAVANVLQALVAGMLLLFFFARVSNINFAAWKFSKQRAGSFFSEGSLLFLGTIFAIVYLKIDQVMINWFVGPAEVGVYAVAVTLSEVWFFVPAAIVASVFPRLVTLYTEDRPSFDTRFQQLLDLLLIISIAFVTVISVLGPPTISSLFGPEFEASGSILIIHVCSLPFLFLRAALTRWILVEKLPVFFVFAEGGGALLNILLNYFLIPLYGGEGAAVATVISYVAAIYLALLVTARTRKAFYMVSKSIFTPWRGVNDIWKLFMQRR